MNRSSVVTFIVAAFVAAGWSFTPMTARAEEMKEDGPPTQRIHFHGYGELHFNIPEGSGMPDPSNPAQADLHRMVWGMSVQLTDRISIHTEVDFEHAATEIELEYAYVDFMVNPWATIRGGSVLMPIGNLNEYHEPPNFYSVERPYLQRNLIPTTWQEAGAGVVGEWAGVRYRMYVTSGLDASGFTASSGIRDGRGHVAEQPSSGLAYAGRVEYVGIAGITAGASAFLQPQANQHDGGTPDVDTGVQLVEGDLRIRKGGFDLQGTVVQTRIKNAGDLSAAIGQAIGKIQFGWNAEVAFHLLNAISPDSEQDLVPFVRYERFDTQAQMPSGFAANPANNRKVLTFGLSYLPIPQVAIKVDHESWTAGTLAGGDDHGHRTNVGLAWMFY